MNVEKRRLRLRAKYVGALRRSVLSKSLSRRNFTASEKQMQGFRGGINLIETAKREQAELRIRADNTYQKSLAEGRPWLFIR